MSGLGRGFGILTNISCVAAHFFVWFYFVRYLGGSMMGICIIRLRRKWRKVRDGRYIGVGLCGGFIRLNSSKSLLKNKEANSYGLIGILNLFIVLETTTAFWISDIDADADSETPWNGGLPWWVNAWNSKILRIRMNLVYCISVLEIFKPRMKNVVASAWLTVLCNSVRVEHNIKFYNLVQATIMIELDIKLS